MRHRRATIDDVAKLAGVTKGTVSRVLKGTYQVSEKTSQAVHHAATQLHYTPMRQALALATGRTNTIGIVITEPFDLLFEDPTFRTIIKGIFSYIASGELIPILLQATNHREQEKTLQLATNRGVDGLIHLSPWGDTFLLDALQDCRIPTVLCGQLPEEKYKGHFSAVYASDFQGGKQIAEYLKHKGIKHPCAILGDSDQPASLDRLRGFQHVFPKLTTNRHVYFRDWTTIGGYEGVKHLFRREVQFDGLLCGSDRIARGALIALREAGIEVPAEVRVTGYDDGKIADDTPGLTTIAQPMETQGQDAVKLLISLMANNDPETIVLPTKLVIRQTA
ncbi:LacI family DNA-binding transcriptional regulator [Gleimia hominis]|uniref:LacI family DNA-binding transcriptional regulator n=1 Tax=Gleimia hominis TaxID=595468 RepID=A0ABU3ICE3_9ACTO|nr:LacI family DNA-binding transcriptional regulator [Gleimia hominis]MDT3766880.1 LacI family DNA-binding transcriptional regulator [Gleimia hominis]